MGIGVVEIWRPVVGYEENYSVSNLGRVFSRLSNKVLKPNKMATGYLSVELFDNGKSKRLLIHRLVASAFLDNPNGYPMINHKDENRSNNEVSNLEWCTAKYNQNYGTCQERKKKALNGYWASEKCHIDSLYSGKRTKELLGIRTVQKALDGTVVNEFVSVNEAARQTGIRHIHEVCVGRRKTAGGYIWEFKKERM